MPTRLVILLAVFSLATADSTTLSQTVSSSATRTPSQTPSSFTSSNTPSQSVTPSHTPSNSRTPSQTPSQSPTPSQTPSQSRTQTQSPSVTPSQSVTQTQTPSQSRTPTQTPSQSRTQTQSPSQTRTQTESPSQTPSQSVTQTQTPSQSTTQTQTPSQTPTQTQTPSQTRTQTLTPTQTTSPSLTASLTQTPSLTGSRSQSTSQTQTATLTKTQTQSRTPTSPTTTASISLSPSFRPFALTIATPTAAPTADSGALLLSDSLPQEALALWLDRCPPAEDLSLVSATCYVSVASSAPGGPPAAPYAGLPQLSSQPISLSSSCSASANGVLLPVSLVIGAYPGTGSGAGTLSCDVVSSGTASNSSSSSSAVSLAHASAPLNFQATAWPLLADVIIALRDGVLRSSLLGSVNASDQLLAACASFALPGGCSLDAASSDPLAFLSAAEATWNNTPVPASTTSTPFSMTLSGPTLLVLRARRWAFGGALVASLGGITCSVIGASSDGQWAVILSPNATDLPSAGGYLQMILANPPLYAPNAAGSKSAVDGGFANATLRGAALSCPPFCPGLDASVVPFPLDKHSEATSFAAALLVAPPGSGAPTVTIVSPPTPPSSSSASSVGFYYAEVCAATGLYTDPATGACTNASDPASLLCAFGSGATCRLCPTGALCPGGARAWPRPGYYVAGETTGQVTPCPPPTQRCAGWDAPSGITACGPGYLTGSYLCSACADGFYPVGDGTCSACPASTNTWVRYRGLLALLAGVGAFVGLVWAGLYLLTRIVGGTLAGGIARFFSLLIWSITTVQVVSQVARVHSTSLPPLLQDMYRAVSVLQLDGIVLPPACTGSYAFETEVILMAAALSLLACCILFFWLNTTWSRLLGRFAMVGSVVLFPTVTTDVTGLLTCSSAAMSVTAVLTLDGGAAVATAAAAGGQTSLTVSVLSNNPFFVCWYGSHASAGGLSIVTIIFYVVALPTIAMFWLWRDPWLRKQLGREPATPLECFDRAHWSCVTHVVWSGPLSCVLWCPSFRSTPRSAPAPLTPGRRADKPEKPPPPLLPAPVPVPSSVAVADDPAGSALPMTANPLLDGGPNRAALFKATRASPPRLVSRPNPLRTSSLSGYASALRLKTLPVLPQTPRGISRPAAPGEAAAAAGASSKEHAAACAAESRAGAPSDTVVFVASADGAVAANPILAPFLADFQPRAWVFEHVDLTVLFVLAVLEGVLPRPNNLQQILAKTLIAMPFLALLFAYVVVVRPYLPEHAWRVPVKALLVVVSAGCVMLNASVLALDLGTDGAAGSSSSATLGTSVTVGAYLLFVLCVLTAVVLLLSFCRAMYLSAQAEQLEHDRGLDGAWRSKRATMSGLMPSAPRYASTRSGKALGVGSGSIAESRRHMRSIVRQQGAPQQQQLEEGTGVELELTAVPRTQSGRHLLRASASQRRVTGAELQQQEGLPSPTESDGSSPSSRPQSLRRSASRGSLAVGGGDAAPAGASPRGGSKAPLPRRLQVDAPDATSGSAAAAAVAPARAAVVSLSSPTGFAGASSIASRRRDKRDLRHRVGPSSAHLAQAAAEPSGDSGGSGAGGAQPNAGEGVPAPPLAPAASDRRRPAQGGNGRAFQF